MRLTVFNGSPRGESGNSALLMEHFLKGFQSTGGNAPEIFYLNRVKETDTHVQAFQGADHAILISPLYTDAMPGIVKHFIETLEPMCGRGDNPTLGFIIQSGFPEPAHSRYVARYMEKLTKRLGCRHSGTVIRGGVEGVRMQPPWMTKRLFKAFFNLGEEYSKTGQFDKAIIRKLAPRERLSVSRKLFFRFMKLVGISNMYWNMMLKKHNAYERRFAHPYKDF
jgi:NAD(P)H-dependent FMN reductase